MADPQLRLDQMLTKLREHKFRITPQRLAILKILSVSDGHPSVERIFEQVKADFPTTSLATLYKTVTLLKQLNEVLELGFSGSGNRYDGNRPYPHPHVICTVCGNIVDPEPDAAQNITKDIAKETGYFITNHRLDFFGICPECQKGKP
ncbi:MAG: transcriptional repressor [Deltaproteobacteria bacterium]|nr:transcriptional repressor [Deltaproteobacteria bacterium]MBW2345152.1 transcriptional repressor [Deltaproteobacteria bacterium]